MADKAQIISAGIHGQTGNAGNNVKPVASSAPASFAPFFRRRTLGRGRAPSPPTWGCYEQIPLEYSDSEDVDDDDDDDDEEDDDDNYIETDSDEHSVSGSETCFQPATKPCGTESQGHAMEMEMEMEGESKQDSNVHQGVVVDVEKSDRMAMSMDMDMDMDVDGRICPASDATKQTCGSADGEHCSDARSCPCHGSHHHHHHHHHHVSELQKKKQDKGKQRAVEPVSSSTTEEEKNEKSADRNARKGQRNGGGGGGGGNRNRKRRDRESNHILRPILTIKKSDGFVWNQELFIPSYIKDRYIASTSPPSSNIVSSSSSSGVLTNDFNDHYEIEVVEIRVQGNELEGIIS